jgi:RNA polymerase sigma-70 factor (ECF subfamily)
MTDTGLLELYENRHESAIAETAKQYNSYCLSIAVNILQNREDAEEVVNDAFLNAWNAIPPERPRVFSAFLGRITRNLSLDRYKAQKAKKRGGRGGDGTTTLLLSELKECIPAAQNVEQIAEARDLTRIMEDYLATIREDDKIFFIRRYWHGDSTKEISSRFNASVSRINTSLHRTREKLKVYLGERGITYED